MAAALRLETAGDFLDSQCRVREHFTYSGISCHVAGTLIPIAAGDVTGKLPEVRRRVFSALAQ